MSVNPRKSRTVLVVHGVQLGADKDQKQHKLMKNLIDNRLGNLPLKYSTDLYRYEDINDKVVQPAKKLMKSIGKTAAGKVVVNATMDLIGDVVINLVDASVAQKIRDGLKQKILSIYEAGNPCYLVAHSLGSIYAFDVVNELIRDENLASTGSDDNRFTDWPGHV